MAIQITEQIVLDYLVKDLDLPEGLRLVSVKFDPHTRKLRQCELQSKNGLALKIGDWLLNSGRVFRPRRRHDFC